jgi:hypothetical protein
VVLRIGFPHHLAVHAGRDVSQEEPRPRSTARSTGE